MTQALDAPEKAPHLERILGWVSHAESISTMRQALLRSVIEPSADEIRAGLKIPGAAHHALAELVVRGYVRVIVTTNFDRLIEAALRMAGIEEQMLSGPGDLPGMIPLQHAACTVIKLHGDYQQANLINTDAELAEYDPQWLGLLRRVLAEYGLVTVGWSGQSDTALRREIVAAAGRRYGCFLGVQGLVTGNICGLTETRLIVECKRWNKPVDAADVEAFAGLLVDVGADMGFLVSAAGAYEGAVNRARANVAFASNRCILPNWPLGVPSGPSFKGSRYLTPTLIARRSPCAKSACALSSRNTKHSEYVSKHSDTTARRTHPATSTCAA
jgi:SIR2-like domain/Restriction endonuclease